MFFWFDISQFELFWNTSQLIFMNWFKDEMFIDHIKSLENRLKLLK